ncbi:hypothetical protein LSH36_321g00011 [Paralvinella palmiformis]|uniref:NADH dehydrogenase [ubiquinone] 1 beta subcomplex subunit 10 n=1 Tax=Paralvinella palmiformis TaxID=53620 RepID=A0AAD9JGF9_9ANNE|nr:hypothetical protein LSH36_321g00011 [Paralvinella palmiformis]
MPDDPGRAKSTFEGFLDTYFNIFNKPIEIVRENIVGPLKNKNPPKYYHRRYKRIPSIDECSVGDEVCLYEANEQYKRDMKVESQILIILRHRLLECEFYWSDDKKEKCKKQQDDYKTAETNWFVKYGDLGAKANVLEAYMKQKHRMIWERRHGEVGTGMKET